MKINRKWTYVDENLEELDAVMSNLGENLWSDQFWDAALEHLGEILE